jgi:hypothetical protein
MANTPIKDARDPLSTRMFHTIDHDGPASYPTGGEVIPASVFGFKNLANVKASGSDNSTHFCTPVFTTKGDRVSFKLVWSVVATGIEVANTTNLSARFARLTGYGR